MGMWDQLQTEMRCSSIVYSKQARRTGMAGPLGEMFDHGIYLIYF